MNSAYTNSKLRHSIETGFDGTGSGRTSEGLAYAKHKVSRPFAKDA
jgi:hypothetical protein